MTKFRAPLTQNILTSLTELISAMQAIEIEENEARIKPTVARMLEQLIEKREKLQNQIQSAKGTSSYYNLQVLSELLDIVKEHRTELEVAPGFWNKLAYHINNFFGVDLFNVNKTQLGKNNFFKAHKEEFETQKDRAYNDCLSISMGF